MSNNAIDQKEQLMRDLRAVMTDAQQLVQSGSESWSSQASETRQRLQATMEQLKKQLGEIPPAAQRTMGRWQHASDEYVHQNPWKSMGAAVGVGLVVGMLIGRR